MRGLIGIWASAAVLLTGLGGAAGAEQSAAWQTGGFDMPESALELPGGAIALSVMVGNPLAADGEGGIALLSKEGAVVDADWVTGLDAPKGMAVAGDRLFVADLTRVHVIDANSGAELESIEAPGAGLLNDVTSDGSRVWVSDMMGDTIWLYENGTLAPWLQGGELAAPNGVLFDQGRLIVANWGAGIQADFTTESPGSLLSVDVDTKEVSLIAKEVGNLDGVVRFGDALLVNDWLTGEIFRVADGSVTPFLSFRAGLADIGVAGNMLLLPMMFEGQLQMIRF